MRVGSLEVVAAAGLFAYAALRRPKAPEDAGSVMRLALDVYEHGRLRHVELDCPAVVGRSPETDLMVLDPEVSRRHARFENDGKVVFLTDLESSNGTFLNGKRLRETIEVRPGDQIDVGAARVTFLGGTLR